MIRLFIRYVYDERDFEVMVDEDVTLRDILNDMHKMEGMRYKDVIISEEVGGFVLDLNIKVNELGLRDSDLLVVY